MSASINDTEPSKDDVMCNPDWLVLMESLRFGCLLEEIDMLLTDLHPNGLSLLCPG